MLTVPVTTCLKCRVREASASAILKNRSLNKVLAHAEMEWEALEHRPSTVKSRQRGVSDFQRFGDKTAEVNFPVKEEGQLARYIIYSVKHRVPTLDASTLRNHVNSVSAAQQILGARLGVRLRNPARTTRVRRLLKIAMDEFKKPSQARQGWSLGQFGRMLKRGFDMQTRAGRHQRLVLWLHTLGVLRKRAGSLLRVRYRVQQQQGKQVIHWKSSSDVLVQDHEGGKIIVCKVNVDKNVKAWKLRETVIPSVIEIWDFHPVAELETYILQERPPSGSYLTAAPLGKSDFRSTPYSNQSNSMKKAFLRAHPHLGADSVKFFGSQSCRKSIASWLWDDDWDKRVIADHGGWALQRDAVDLYFKTGRTKMLWALQHMGHVQQRRRRSLNMASRGNTSRRQEDR